MTYSRTGAAPSTAWSRWPLGDPNGQPFGTLQFTSHRTEDGQIRRTIDVADPRIVVADEFVQLADPARVVLDNGWGIGGFVSFVGDERTVIYRVVDRNEAHRLWLLEWPD